MEWLENTLDIIVSWATNTGLKLLIALVLMFVSFKIINWVAKRIIKNGEKKKLDKTIIKTISYLVKIGGKVIVTVCLVGYVGIDTSGLSALVASLGVTVGLALNGALGNLAGGMLIILTRPFRLDDYIEAMGYSGTVEAINLTNTKLCTPDNKVVYLPNGSLSSASIVNYSEKDIRRVDNTFEIAKDADVEKAKQILHEIASNHELVLKNPEPYVRITAHNVNSTGLTLRVWVNNQDYWTVNADVLESVKTAFDQNGIVMPIQQVDVKVNQK